MAWRGGKLCKFDCESVSGKRRMRQKPIAQRQCVNRAGSVMGVMATFLLMMPTKIYCMPVQIVLGMPPKLPKVVA